MPLLPSTLDDIPQAISLINSAYRGDSARAGWTHEADYLTGVRIDAAALEAELRRKPEAKLLVWRDSPGEPILACVWIEPQGDGPWYLGMLTVRPDLQDRGLGRQVLEQAEEKARSAGADRIRMTVISIRDSLIAWYGRRGYRETGERLPFPYDERFGRALRDDLEFVVLEKVI